MRHGGSVHSTRSRRVDDRRREVGDRNRRRVLGYITRHGPCTRKEIGLALGFSFTTGPSCPTAMRHCRVLEAGDLVGSCYDQDKPPGQRPLLFFRIESATGP